MRVTMIWLAALMMSGSVLAQTPVMLTSLSDQTELAVTAYNNGIALVRDVRTLRLPVGDVHLRFGDVAQQIRPETVGLRSLSAAGSVTILEQNYEYDLISPSKLMEKYVGKPVRLVNFSTEIGFDVAEGELLSVNEGPIYKINGEIYLGHPGNVVLPEIPENLIAKPSLIWLVANQQAEQTLEATYLTNGITWTADYVVTLAKSEASLDIAGWVTMNNQSGATYTNAKLKLVAGDVNVVQEYMDEKGLAFFGAGMNMVRASMPKEEAFGEYHLYTMPRPTTIKQNQSKQLALLNGAGVACKKRYEYRGEVHFYSQPVPPMREQHVPVFLVFENRQKNGLGIPLPAGVMRVYQEDSEGMLQFSGEDRIEHTPKNEKVELRMGTAFDVVAERIQTEYEVIARNIHQSAYKITVRNHKTSDIVVDIVEPMPGDWRILEKSMEFEKKDAQTVVFHLPVAKDGEAVVTYRVQVKH